MTELLKEISNTIFELLGPDFLLSFFIKSSVLISTAFLIQQLLRRYSSLVRYTLWSVSLIGILIIPFVPELEKPIEIGFYGYQSFSELPYPAPSTELTSAPQIHTMEKVAKDRSLITLSVFEIVTLLWLVGITFFLGLLLKEMIWLRKIVSTGDRANELDPLVQTCKKQLRLKRKTKILFNSAVDAPMTFGSVVPVIVLPLDARNWNGKKLKMILLHELLHIKRNDYLTNLGASLGAILCWYNPIVWFALKYQKIECEKACDEQVLSHNISPKLYATELLKIAEVSQKNGKLQLNSVISILGATGIKDRIKRILESPSHNKAISLSMMIALCLFVLFEAFSISTIQFYTDDRNDDLQSNQNGLKTEDLLENLKSPELSVRQKAARLLINSHDYAIVAPILLYLNAENDAQVKIDLIKAIAKFGSSKEFYQVARQINSSNTQVKLEVLEYMKIISCFPSYLVIEASTNDKDLEIAKAAREHLTKIDERKLKSSIKNFATNFRYNNPLSTKIGQKMGWIEGYDTITQLSGILKSGNALKKKELGEQLLAVSEEENYDQLKTVIHNIY